MLVSMVCIVTSTDVTVDGFSNASHVYQRRVLALMFASTFQAAAAASTDHCGLSSPAPPFPQQLLWLPSTPNTFDSSPHGSLDLRLHLKSPHYARLYSQVLRSRTWTSFREEDIQLDSFGWDPLQPNTLRHVLGTLWEFRGLFMHRK